jgi:hypothetical protein
VSVSVSLRASLNKFQSYKKAAAPRGPACRLRQVFVPFTNPDKFLNFATHLCNPLCAIVFNSFFTTKPHKTIASTP